MASRGMVVVEVAGKQRSMPVVVAMIVRDLSRELLAVDRHDQPGVDAFGIEIARKMFIAEFESRGFAGRVGGVWLCSQFELLGGLVMGQIDRHVFRLDRHCVSGAAV